MSVVIVQGEPVGVVVGSLLVRGPGRSALSDIRWAHDLSSPTPTDIWLVAAGARTTMSDVVSKASCASASSLGRDDLADGPAVANVSITASAQAVRVHTPFMQAGNALGAGTRIKKLCVAALYGRRISFEHNRPGASTEGMIVPSLPYDSDLLPSPQFQHLASELTDSGGRKTVVPGFRFPEFEIALLDSPFLEHPLTVSSGGIDVT